MALTAKCHLLNSFGANPNFGRNPATPSMAEEAAAIARGLGDDHVLGDALCELGWSTYLAGDLPAALAVIEEAVALARAVGSPHLLETALGGRAVFNGDVGELAAASADLQEVLALARAAGDDYVIVTTLVNLGVDQIVAGDLRAAIGYLREAHGVAEAHGYQHLAAGVAVNLGFTYLLDGAAASARPLLISVLGAARATGEKIYVPVAILGLALAVDPSGDPTVAATLHGAADRQYEQTGQAFDAVDERLRASHHARLLDALGAAAFDAASQRGRALSQGEAIALALSTAELSTARPDPAPAPAAPLPAGATVPTARRPQADGQDAPLSARERQILALLAGGASNAKIAETLFVTPNTVRTHLDRIRDKTRARNRAELTRYALQAGIEPVVPAP